MLFPGDMRMPLCIRGTNTHVIVDIFSYISLEGSYEKSRASGAARHPSSSREASAASFEFYSVSVAIPENKFFRDMYQA